jgi:hypothetical protein
MGSGPGGIRKVVHLKEMHEETADVGLPQLFRAAPINAANLRPYKR